MEIGDLCNTINFANRDFSLVLINPKDSLLEWFHSFWKRSKLGLYRNYIPEENTVLVIPSIDRFSEVGSLDCFLDDIKPKLLLSELRRFHASPEEFGRPITKEVFDEYFTISLRDSASLTFLADFGIH